MTGRRRLVLAEVVGRGRFRGSFALRVDGEHAESRYVDCLTFDEALGVCAAFVLARPLPYLHPFAKAQASALKWGIHHSPEAIDRFVALHELASCSPRGRVMLPPPPDEDDIPW